VWAAVAVVGGALTVWLQDSAETQERPKGWYATQDPAPLLHQDVSDDGGEQCPGDATSGTVVCAWPVSP
jgi:hypothetical protein